MLLRAIVEGYEGLAMLYGDGSGRVALTTTDAQAPTLDALLQDLRDELGFEPLVDQQPYFSPSTR